MKYPHGRCADCGERLFDTIDGTFRCFNCGRTYPSEETESDRDVERQFA